MANRTAKFVSAIFASVLAGAPLATLSHNAARAADDCLAAPKDETPEGGHWYYRIDHASKRQCWYLREEGEKLSARRRAEFLALREANPAESSEPDRSVRSPTLTPNCPRRPISNSRGAMMR